MNANRYIAALPMMKRWIKETLATHANARTPVQDLRFHRLPQYFSQELLQLAGVVPVVRVPIPPLSTIGLSEFERFESRDMAAITFMDTYFVRFDSMNDESLHFHEMIHIVQWRALGVDAFLLLYAHGLARHGYVDAPLERIAYRHQARFKSEPHPYGVETEVLKEIRPLADGLPLAR